MKPKRKISVVGAGAIGSTTAYVLALRQSSEEVSLVNRNSEKAAVKAFDMSHCLPFIGTGTVTGGGIEASAGSRVVIMTAGVLPKKDGSRMDVLARNLDIYRELVPKLARLSPEAVFITVTNPVDLMTLAAARYSEFPASRVLGTGTLLDTLRFRSFIGQALDVSSNRVEAFVLGEHGESMVPVWSGVRIDGIPLRAYAEERGVSWDRGVRQAVMEKTRRAGWDIRLGGQHSRYAIAFSAALLAEAVLQGAGRVFPASVDPKGAFGARDVYMSLPVAFGTEGQMSPRIPDLQEEERLAMEASAALLARHARLAADSF